MNSEVRVGVLGSVQAVVDGSVVQPGRQLARLLAALAVDAPRTVSDEVLMDRLWGDDPPATGRASLQVFMGRLRRLLEPDRSDGTDWSVIVRDGTGYRLVLDEDALDRRRVEHLVADAAPRVRSDPGQALTLLDAALACWRGDPWAEVADEPWIADEMSIIVEVQAHAESMRVDALLNLSRPDDAASAARALVAARPFDEGARGQLMRALYRSGRQQEALREFDRTRKLLVNQVGVEPGPELQQLLAAILDHDPRLGSSVEEGRTPGGVTNLSHPATPFVGRRSELDEVAGLIARTRLVTLTGPGGTGKTRLATEAGWRVLDQFPDGVWFVDLDAVETGDQVADELAEALSLYGNDSSGGDDPMDLVCGFVAERRTLVILDNCERLVDPTAMVATRLIGAGGGVHVLATSRRELDVEGERVVSIPPLAVPPPGAAKDEVIASPAARLFVQRAADLQLDLDDPVTLDAVTAVVRALEGIPLALELAAGRLGILTLPELYDAMADRFTVLVAKGGTPPDRHAAVRASFDISHGLLREPEREFFGRLGLVNGPVTLDLFGAPGEADRTEAMTLLDRLVASSLVDRVETSGIPGYRLLESTREYARLRLEEDGTLDAASEWLAARVTRFVERSEIALRGSTQREVLAALDANYVMIRALLDRLVASGRTDLAQPIVIASAPYWFLRPHRGDGVRIISALRATVDPTDRLARACLVQAEAECARGKDNALGRLRPDLLEAVDVFAEHGLDEELVTSIALLAVGAAWTGNLDEMRRIRKLSASALERLGSAWHGTVDGFMDALEAGLAGDFQRGIDELVTARDRFIDLGDRSWAARASYFAGLFGQVLGDEEGFRTNVMTSIELSELAGGCGMDGRISLALADAAVEGGDARAEWMLLRASDLLERHGDVIGVAKCRRELASLAVEAGNDARANDLFDRSLPVLAELEPPALALGLAQKLPLLRRTATDAEVEETVEAIRAIESNLAGHSSPDLRRLRTLTRG